MGLRVLRAVPELLPQLLAVLPPGMIVGSVPSDRSIGLLLSAGWWEDSDPNADEPMRPTPEVVAICHFDSTDGTLKTTISLLPVGSSKVEDGREP